LTGFNPPRNVLAFGFVGVIGLEVGATEGVVETVAGAVVVVAGVEADGTVVVCAGVMVFVV